MTDLTKIEKPFGLLDKETQDALKAHFEGVGVVQVYDEGGWRETGMPQWYDRHTYRAVPKKHKIKLFIHLYMNGMFDVYPEPRPVNGAIAVKQIEVELTEGEGL